MKPKAHQGARRGVGSELDSMFDEGAISSVAAAPADPSSFDEAEYFAGEIAPTGGRSKELFDHWTS